MRWIDIPPVWLLVFALIAFASRGLLVWPQPALAVVGTALVALGLLLMLWAVLTMLRARTTPVPHMSPSALVTTGPFAFSRNPIYLGDALVLAGLSLRWGAPLGLLLVPLFCALIARRFIAAEESRLAAGFGPAWADWSARVRRWI